MESKLRRWWIVGGALGIVVLISVGALLKLNYSPEVLLNPEVAPTVEEDGGNLNTKNDSQKARLDRERARFVVELAFDLDTKNDSPEALLDRAIVSVVSQHGFELEPGNTQDSDRGVRTVHYETRAISHADLLAAFEEIEIASGDCKWVDADDHDPYESLEGVSTGHGSYLAVTFSYEPFDKRFIETGAAIIIEKTIPAGQ